MLVVVVCAAMLVAGVAAGVAWGNRPFAAPDPTVELTALEVVRRFAWYLSLALGAGPIAGVLVIGAGGRLAMRLLAVTAGDDAQGRITEADEVVGAITTGGSASFIAFNGIFGGIVTAILYLLVRRFLPAGRLGGVAFGLGLLIVLGAVVDPLRADNPDFDIVGPGWVSVATFTALAVAYGVALRGIVHRASGWLPLPSAEARVLVRYAVPAVLAVLAFTATVLAAVVGVLVIVVTRWGRLVDAVRSSRWVLVGRVLTVALVVVSLPNALSSMADIVTR